MSFETTLRIFLGERPAINHTAFAKECGMDRTNFLKILLGLRNIPKAKRGLVLAAMKKYGLEE